MCLLVEGCAPRYSVHLFLDFFLKSAQGIRLHLVKMAQNEKFMFMSSLYRVLTLQSATLNVKPVKDSGENKDVAILYAAPETIVVKFYSIEREGEEDM